MSPFQDQGMSSVGGRGPKRALLILFSPGLLVYISKYMMEPRLLSFHEYGTISAETCRNEVIQHLSTVGYHKETMKQCYPYQWSHDLKISGSQDQ
ncbi:unnamed protein product [Timema podura]|uniref:Uncharacterized protein n=1 Tax=Timema podura TaxID=61482 RepID=A0ABN7PBM6_TIMPD|nr:unnamed protein product [Timema podura]